MLEVIFAGGILDVQVVAVFDNPLHRHPPGVLVLLPVVPPCQAIGKFLELDRLGFGVVLPPFRQRLFIVPDLFRRPGAVEEKEVGGDTGSRPFSGDDA